MRALVPDDCLPVVTVQEATPDGWTELLVEVAGRIVAVEVLPPARDVLGHLRDLATAARAIKGRY